MATIQWFPGHMSKARRQVQENLKHVDFVTILVDARLPLSSQNPMLTKIVGDKPKLLILNKADLAVHAAFLQIFVRLRLRHPVPLHQNSLCGVDRFLILFPALLRRLAAHPPSFFRLRLLNHTDRRN